MIMECILQTRTALRSCRDPETRDVANVISGGQVALRRRPSLVPATAAVIAAAVCRQSGSL